MKKTITNIQIEKNFSSEAEKKKGDIITCLCPKHNIEMIVTEKSLGMLGNVKVAQCSKCQNLYIGRTFMNAEMIVIEGVRYQYFSGLKCQEPLLSDSKGLSLNEQQDDKQYEQQNDKQHKEKTKTQKTGKNIKSNSCEQNLKKTDIIKERKTKRKKPKNKVKLQNSRGITITNNEYQSDISIQNNEKTNKNVHIRIRTKSSENPKTTSISQQDQTCAICYKVSEPKIQKTKKKSKNKQQECYNNYNNEYYNAQKKQGINFAISENILYICKSASVCKQKNHNIELIKGYVANPNGKYPIINANYCKDCKRYFIDYKEYSHYRDLYGIIMGNFRDIDIDRYETSVGNLAEQSILHLNSYNVGEKDGLSVAIRQKILAHLMDYNILSKPEILSLLSFFIDLNTPKERMALAISKWDADMKFVRNYQLDSQRSVLFNEIRHNKNNNIITNLSSAQTYTPKQEITSHVVTGQCTLIALILDYNKETTFFIDIAKNPKQKSFIGMEVNDCFKLNGVPLTYKIKKIILT